MGGSRGMLAANQPLIVPMLLRLSNFKLNSYVVLVVSKQKGITLVFKTDPLQNVDINSTFDSITVIQKFIQKEIEGQLRQMFREDLPGIIHRLSQQWIKRSTTVEAPYLAKRPPLRPRQHMDTMSNPELMRMRPSSSPVLDPYGIRHPPKSQASQRGVSRSVSGRMSPSGVRTPETPEYQYDQESGTFVSKFPETKAFSHLGRLHRESRGLADLAEEDGSEFGGTDNEGSFDVVDWDDTMTDVGPPVSEANMTEFESIPAVGGGTITRPRVYHSASLMHTKPSTSHHSNSSSVTSLTSPALQRLSQSVADVGQYPSRPYRSRGSLPSLRGDWDRSSLYGGTTYSESPQYRTPVSAFPYRPKVEDELDEFPFEHPADLPSLSRRLSDTVQSGSSIPSTSAVQLDTPNYPDPDDPDLEFNPDSPKSHLHSQSQHLHLPHRKTSNSRRSSVSSQGTSPFSPYTVYTEPGDNDAEEGGSVPKIVLRPGINNAISQLSLLNRSNHTLSPFTRPLEHFMIRSVPPRTLFTRGGSPKGPKQMHSERQPVKAKRKRVYRVGGSKGPENGNGNQNGGDSNNLKSNATPNSTPQVDKQIEEEVEEVTELERERQRIEERIRQVTAAKKANSTPSSSDPPWSPLSNPSELDPSEIDRYFRSRDDYIPSPLPMSRSSSSSLSQPPVLGSPLVLPIPISATRTRRDSNIDFSHLSSNNSNGNGNSNSINSRASSPLLRYRI